MLIYDVTKEELIEFLKAHDYKKYRARASKFGTWLYKQKN